MKCPSTSRLLAPALLPLLLGACGGGGGGGEDLAPGAGAVVAPSIDLTSPTVSGVTDDREVELRGTARAGSSAIADVQVGGRSATTTDGFATWSVTVPVDPGPNVYSVEVEDADGRTTTVLLDPLIVGTEGILVSPRCVTLDPANDRAFVADAQTRELVIVELDTGRRRVLSGPEDGSGPLFGGPIDMFYDSVDKNLVLLDSVLDAIFVVDTLDGTRKLLVATPSGPGPDIASGNAIAPSPSGGDLVLVTTSADGLVEVDLDTGDVREISNNDPALGSPFISPRGLAVDALSDRAYIVDTFRDEVYQVELSTGQRTILPGSATQPLDLPRNLDFDPAEGIVVHDDSLGVVRLDLPTGKRTIVSSPSVGDGPLILSSFDVEVADGFAYLADVELDAVVSVELATGDRAVIGGLSVGDGPRIARALDLEVAPDDSTIAVNLSGPERIVRVAPSSGDREVLVDDDDVAALSLSLSSTSKVDVHPVTGDILFGDSSNLLAYRVATGQLQHMYTSGFGEVGTLRDALWDPASTTAFYVLDSTDEQLVHVSLSGLEETVVADGLADAFLLARDLAGNRIAAMGDARVVLVDLATGASEIVVDVEDQDGAAVELESAIGIVIDDEAGILYVFDENLRAIVSVDLESGERRLVASEFQGRGLALADTGGMTLSQDGRTLFLFDPQTSSVLGISIATGDRLVVSR